MSPSDTARSLEHLDPTSHCTTSKEAEEPQQRHCTSTGADSTSLIIAQNVTRITKKVSDEQGYFYQ
jgi:hypothetical protein